jgi:hypothetical protein
MALVTGAPWYEFWQKGIWSLGGWTHLHATAWVWIARGDLVLGLVLALALVVLLSSEYGFHWSGVALAVLIFAVWALIPFVSQTLAVFALLVPAVLVWVGVSEGWERVQRPPNRNRAPGGPETRT